MKMEDKVKRLLAMSIIIGSSLTLSEAYASSIGCLLGLGHYWIDGSSSSGFALNGYVDINKTGNLSLAPAFGFWVGSEDDVNIFELNPSFAFKILFPAGTIKPYVGVEPELHIFFVEDETLTRFGFSLLSGLDILFSEYLSMPIQIGYGKFFYEDGSTNTFNFQVGIAIK